MSLEHFNNVFIWQLLLTVKSLTIKLEADTELSTVKLLVFNVDELVIDSEVIDFVVNSSVISDEVIIILHVRSTITPPPLL